ncbi:MAG: acyl carrier protein [Dehalococcoidales bacterium]
MATIFDRVKRVVVEQLGVDEEDVVPTASFVDDMGADSLDLVELRISLEEEFSTPSREIEIPEEDAEDIITAQDAVDYLRDLGVEDE